MSFWVVGTSDLFLLGFTLVYLLSFRAHLAAESISKRAFYRTVLMKGFHLLVMMFATRQVQDTQCGFKLFTREAARILFSENHMRGWSFDIELIYIAEVLGIPMKEVHPIFLFIKCKSMTTKICIILRCQSIGVKLMVRNSFARSTML